jgi:hypothetical protein
MSDRVVKYYAVPRASRVGQCREPTCRKTIYWIESPTSGKQLPIDCEADAECRPPFGNEDGVGVSHFTTCKNPNRFSHPAKDAADA